MSGLIQWVLPAQFICSVVKRICNLRDYLKEMLLVLSNLFSKIPLKIGQLRINVTTVQ